MTSDGYCTLGEFSSFVNRHPDVIRSWVKTGKFTLPADKKKYRGRDVYKATALTAEYERHCAVVKEKEAAREARRYAYKPNPYVKKETAHRGKFDSYKLEPIKLPKVMTENDMTGFRKLGRRLIADALMDLGSPCKSDKRNRSEEGQELTVSNAKRWLLGESDQEMLTLACSLAKFSETYIKEKVRTTKSFPSRTAMKKWFGAWKKEMREKSNSDLVVFRTNASDYKGYDFGFIPDIPSVKPAYMTRQHNRQPATAP
jgi:hypothetical protein